MKEKRERTEREENRRKKRLIAAGAAVLAVLLLITAGAYLLLHHYHSRSNYQSDDEVTLAGSLPEDSGDIEGIDRISPEELNQFEFPNGDYVYNILLIGSDKRDDSWYGNSDAMILASVNKKTNTIYLTSFMRDLYAEIPGVGAGKLNSAYAVGGGPLLVQTIEENYRIRIDNYASVDFEGMIDIIDMVGGITIDIRPEEAEGAKIHINDMCYRRGDNPEDYYIKESGNVHLNGTQAVAYARIRYVGNSDYERTERQRKVLQQIFMQVKELNLLELNDFANNALPYITHNITEGELISLLASLPSVVTYGIDLDRIPYDGSYSVSGEMLVPDFPATIQRLQERIYAQ